MHPRPGRVAEANRLSGSLIGVGMSLCVGMPMLASPKRIFTDCQQYSSAQVTDTTAIIPAS